MGDLARGDLVVPNQARQDRQPRGVRAGPPSGRRALDARSHVAPDPASQRPSAPWRRAYSSYRRQPSGSTASRCRSDPPSTSGASGMGYGPGSDSSACSKVTVRSGVAGPPPGRECRSPRMTRSPCGASAQGRWTRSACRRQPRRDGQRRARSKRSSPEHGAVRRPGIRGRPRPPGRLGAVRRAVPSVSAATGRSPARARPGAQAVEVRVLPRVAQAVPSVSGLPGWVPSRCSTRPGRPSPSRSSTPSHRPSSVAVRVTWGVAPRKSEAFRRLSPSGSSSSSGCRRRRCPPAGGTCAHPAPGGW